MEDLRIGQFRAIAYFVDGFDRWNTKCGACAVELAERYLERFQGMENYSGGRIETFISEEIGWIVAE